ncbi:MAG: hypothetical protein E6Q97_15895 [Desulfurellales bacterium]|nr:MAG: hypothetical protein E6Q97_15895 [Desulfurellales bacterium]
MKITQRQLTILRAIQAEPAIDPADLAARLGERTHRDIKNALSDFAKANGMPGYTWFLDHLSDYDLSTLKPYRLRAGAAGIIWNHGIWYAKVAGRWSARGYAVRSDAIAERRRMLAEQGEA